MMGTGRTFSSGWGRFPSEVRDLENWAKEMAGRPARRSKPKMSYKNRAGHWIPFHLKNTLGNRPLGALGRFAGRTPGELF